VVDNLLVVDYTRTDVDRVLAMLRRSCLRLPEATERPSHGSPAFFIKDKKCFVMFVDDHHEDGRLAIWCAAPSGVQGEVIETEPDTFFRPPYVGHRGWLGVHLMKVSQAELDAICLEAYREIAPVTLLRRLDRDESGKD
jgi:hypothetical protein